MDKNKSVKQKQVDSDSPFDSTYMTYPTYTLLMIYYYINILINYTLLIMTVLSISSNSTDALDTEDSMWILHLSFIIFTMQTGFGLLEIGCARMKNEVNIMMKNTVDIIFGGLSYWMFGYGFSYGNDYGKNKFIGIGNFFFSTVPKSYMGSNYSHFISQFSYATTARTIVSGALAERIKLGSYIIFQFFNTIIYCVPVHWIWSPAGFLYELGALDAAGSGTLHLLGGSSAFISAILIGPRIGRFDSDILTEINPTNTLVGLFMLWWGWLAFNASCVKGVGGQKWIVVAKAVLNTLNSSIGSGISGILITMIETKGKYNVLTFVNSVLGGLVAVSAGCTTMEPWEAIIVGFFASFIVYFGGKLINFLKIDDPIGAASVHGFGGMWGLLCVGLFCNIDPFINHSRGNIGLFHGGGFNTLGVQALTCFCLICWGILSTFIILGIIKLLVGIRIVPIGELIGADIFEHQVGEAENIDSNFIEIEHDKFSKRRLSGLLNKNEALKARIRSHFPWYFGKDNTVHPPSNEWKENQKITEYKGRRASLGSYKIFNAVNSSKQANSMVILNDSKSTPSA